MTKPIHELNSLGPKSASWLVDVGIKTENDLNKSGPVIAYLKVKQKNPKASLNLLWGIFAAINNMDWREIDSKTKAKLIAQLKKLEGDEP